MRPGRPNRAAAPSAFSSAVAHHQAGRLDEAEAGYRDVLATTPNHFDANHLLGVVALQMGRLEEALERISQAIALDPKVAAAHNNLGNVYLQLEMFDNALEAFERAVAVQPSYADAHFNLGNELRRRGRLQEAASHLRRATSSNARAYDAYTNLGATLFAAGDARGAVAAFEAAAKLKPGSAEALSNLGIALSQAGELLRALDVLDRALSIDASSPGALSNRGAVLARVGRYAEARQCLERAVALEPKSAKAHCNFANALRDNGEPADALRHFERALKLDPGFVQAKVGMALALNDLGREKEARAVARRLVDEDAQSPEALVFEGTQCHERGDLDGAVAAFRNAIALQPSNADAHYHLGNAFMQQLRAGEALASYRRAIDADPDHARARWALTMGQITPLYAEPDDVAKARASFARMLGELDKWFDAAKSIEGYRAVGSTQPYYLAYQPSNNRELLARYGALCARLVGVWQKPRVAIPGPRSPGRIRVGIATAKLCDQSVWTAIVRGWIKHIDRKRYELHLFSLGTFSDGETEHARRQAHRFVAGRRELTQWASEIRNSDLDVLIYPEIGMDPLTVRLASARLSRVQAASWGHPETTGLPTIDYYLSAERLEPPGADTNYTEKLVALPNLGVCYEPLTPAAKDPDFAALGLPHDVPLLLCAGTPFKYLPSSDKLWIDISRRAAPCRIVFFRPADRNVSDALERRLEKQYEKAGLRYADCVTFVSSLDRARFFGLMKRAHALLDTPGFSGFNTAMQAIECGLPVVGHEGEFMRGRLATAILRAIGLDALVAQSDEAYVDIAAKIARDAAFRSSMRDEIVARRASLFGDVAPVRALERFFDSTVTEPKG
jgi:predicted O-linked N-acetylglucosamine transferase (SPINDLY family)